MPYDISIIPIYFFLALSITFMVLYIITPLPKVIVKHPDPKNLKSDLYIDDNGVCYRYKRKEIKCV
jgi:hypothetical protein